MSILARVAVQLRMAEGKTAARRLHFENLVLDLDLHTVTFKSGAGSRDRLEAASAKMTTEETAEKTNVVHLTRTECAILRLLMQNPTQVLSKSQLLDRIGDDTPDCTENSLKMHVSNLRRKLREPGGRDYIEAVWGIGFRMKPAAED